MRPIIVFCILVAGMTGQAQTIQDFFNDKAGQVTWLGIDYSQVTLIGEFTQFKDAGTYNPAEIRDKYFPAWNNLVLNESSKFDFKGMFMLSSLVPDITMITALNAASDPEKIKGNTERKYSIEDIRKIVGKYDLAGREGLGIVIIANALNKTTELASYVVVIFNMKDKEVLLFEPVVEKAGGIGIRNYWGGSLYNLVKDGKKNLYWVWKGKYDK